jgi:putative ABC transport system ATP-binding protein
MNASTTTSPAKTIAVECRGVTKSYGQGAARVQALRGVDIDVTTGELMMLVGPSGCGKTTLISVIAGILDRDGGQCNVFGNDFQKLSGKQRTLYRGKNIGFVFQAYNLLPTLTAAQNAAIPLLIRGERRSRATEQAREVLTKVGFTKRMMDSYPAMLSGGQQQRVAIARAMVHEPRLIVCDEPTSALDHETGHTVMELLRTVALQNDRALIIVTHDARIFEFADRIAQMDDGHIVRIVNSAQELK